MNVLFVIPNDIDLPTGGYRYDREIISEMRAQGHTVELLSLTGDYPFPSDQQKHDAFNMLSELPDAEVAVVDGLAGGALPEFMKALSEKIPVVALVHHPLCLETGLDEGKAELLKRSEAKGLEVVARIITSSQETANTVEKLFGFPGLKIDAVEPGVDRGGLSMPDDGQSIRLLCVGSVIARKGHEDLLKALASLNELDWQLDCIGNIEFDPGLYHKLQDFIVEHSLQGRVTFHGSVDEEEISRFYHRANVFVLPSYYEGYGMVYAEAIVRGIPVIATTAGAIPKTVPRDCGLLVEPGDVLALKTALESMIIDKEKRAEIRQACIDNEPFFPSWNSSAMRFAESLEASL